MLNRLINVSFKAVKTAMQIFMKEKETNERERNLFKTNLLNKVISSLNIFEFINLNLNDKNKGTRSNPKLARKSESLGA